MTVDFAYARFNMVACQIQPNRVTERRILSAFRTVPRELFIPAGQVSVAYRDQNIPLSPYRTLLAPVLLAQMIKAAAPEPEDKILDVACGTGYATAILCHLSHAVYGIEQDPVLAQKARDHLDALQLAGSIVEGPVNEGYRPQAPYDVILLQGMVENPCLHLVQNLLTQLAEGGRLVAVQRAHKEVSSVNQGVGCLTVWRKGLGRVTTSIVSDAWAPMLPEFRAEKSFVL